MLRDLVIFGAGGLGVDTLEVAEAMNEDSRRWNILGFLDDDSCKHGSEVCGYPVLGGHAWLLNRDVDLAICLGRSPLRKRVSDILSLHTQAGRPSLVHPAAVLSRRTEIGSGTVILPGVVIAARTTIGQHVMIGRNASIGHDITIGDYVNIFPSATLSGHSMVGEGTEIGSNATIIPQVRLGHWSIVGAGSVATHDVPDNVTAMGIPANIIMRRNSGWQNDI